MHLTAGSAAVVLGAGGVAGATQSGAHRRAFRPDDIALREGDCAQKLLAVGLVAFCQFGKLQGGAGVDTLENKRGGGR